MRNYLDGLKAPGGEGSGLTSLVICSQHVTVST